jgi:hypothetical protein
MHEVFDFVGKHPVACLVASWAVLELVAQTLVRLKVNKNR